MISCINFMSWGNRPIIPISLETTEINEKICKNNVYLDNISLLLVEKQYKKSGKKQEEKDRNKDTNNHPLIHGF